MRFGQQTLFGTISKRLNVCIRYDYDIVIDYMDNDNSVVVDYADTVSTLL